MPQTKPENEKMEDGLVHWFPAFQRNVMQMRLLDAGAEDSAGCHKHIGTSDCLRIIQGKYKH